MTKTEELLRDAILKKTRIQATYDGHVRHLCPHMMGYKSGVMNVLCYQFGGRSSSGVVQTPSDPSNGPPTLWKCTVVAKLRDVVALPDGDWYTCQKHTERSTCADQIIAEVSIS